MRKFLIVLGVLFIGCTNVFAAKIPDMVKSYILEKVPQADIRFDGVIIFPDNTIYLPLYPSLFSDIKELKIKESYPANQDLKQEPDVIIFNNDFVLLKVLSDGEGHRTVLHMVNPPLQVRTGLLPQDMLVPSGLIIPENIKGIIGNLKIDTKREDMIRVENEDSYESFLTETEPDIPQTLISQLKNKILFVTTNYSKNIQVVEPAKASPSYSLAQKSIPVDVKAVEDGKFLLVTTYDRPFVDIISVADSRFIKQINLTSNPEEILIDEANQKAYITSPTASTIFVIDIKTMSLVQKIKINGYCENLLLAEDKLFYVDKLKNEIWSIELKNQYGIINQHGQILVSELDATNYETSSDMYDFLDKYGVLAPEGEWDTVQVENPEWQVAWDEYNKEYEDWKAREPDKSSEIYWKSGVNNELYLKFIAASKPCYTTAESGESGAGCYRHVLAHLLDLELIEGGGPFRTHVADPSKYPKTYQTTTNETISIDAGRIDGSAINGEKLSDEMVPVSEAVCDPYDIIYAAENETMKQKLLDIYADPTASEQEKTNELLMNNYYFDANGDIQLKTLKQKIIDMYYVLDKFKTLGISYEPALLDLLASFQEDMQQAFKEFDKDAYNRDYNDWLAQEPEKPTVAYYIEEKVPTIENKDMGQWYVNLWHRMNGPSQEKAGTVLEDGTVVEGGKTSGGRPLYKVLEDGLMDNPGWLQSALENGTVTLEQVQFVEEAEVGTGLADCEWASIVWTNAADITESQNEAAITMAEIQYEQALNDIQAKDKQFDNQLKILDTEHNALQTEYDSIKSIIEKTIERNLKLYS